MFFDYAFRKLHYKLYRLLPCLEKRASTILALNPEPVIVDVASSLGSNLEGFQILRKDRYIHAVDIGDFRIAIESKGCIFHQIDLIVDPEELTFFEGGVSFFSAFYSFRKVNDCKLSFFKPSEW